MTTSLLFLLVAAGALVFFAREGNNKVRQALQKKSPHFNLLPKAITLLAITAQASELVKVLEHISFVHIATALFLLTITVALKSGTESELY
jgi:hypothetical protein